MRREHKTGLILILSLITFLRCSGGEGGSIAGGVSDHGNAVAGIVEAEGSVSVESTKVSVYEYDAEPVYGRDDTSHVVEYTLTDSSGYYHISGLEDGKYNIEVRNRVYSALLRGVIIDNSVEREINGDAVLETSGIVRGSLLDDSAKSADRVFCFIRGTSVISQTDDQGNFRLELVPPGSYRIELKSHLSSNNSLSNTDIRSDTLAGSIEDVEIQSDSTTVFSDIVVSEATLQDSDTR
ncbi:MAG: hypothetical protein ACOCSE_01890 [Chitinivibrionales bacterium]